MIEEKKKIKEIYDCEYIVSDEELYPLQEWHNKLIDKSVDEISIADVLRMIRQKELVDLAKTKAMAFLQDNVFAGEGYEGEVLEMISKMDAAFFTLYSHELESIVKEAREKSESHEWLCEEEKDEFLEIVESVSEKIKEVIL